MMNEGEALGLRGAFHRGVDAHLFTALIVPFEGYHPVNEGKQGIIIAAADIPAGMDLRSPLQ
jgi:hypothetical protein